MKNSLIASLLLTAAGIQNARAVETVTPQALVGHDPLTRQIQRRLMQPDGGYSSWTSVTDGKGNQVPIRLGAIDASLDGSAALPAWTAKGLASPAVLGGLNAAPGLMERAVAPVKGKKKIRNADAQLKRIEKKSWGR